MPVDRSSAAHVFFDGLKGSADPLAAIRAMTTSTPPTFETDHLDFKLCVDPRTNTMIADDQIKKIWSEAVGSFANTGGGVLIFGVDCRKTPHSALHKDVDAAYREVLVPHVFAVQSRLKELLKGANDPPVGNVEFLPVIASGDDGFLVCLIPSSDRVPHDCQYVNNKPYMMRSGDNFVQIPAVMLRRMFYPQFSPHLMFTATGSIEMHRGDGVVVISLDLNVVNIGTGTAKDLYIVIKDETGDPKSNLTAGEMNAREWKMATPVIAGGLGFHSIESLHPAQASKLYLIRWQQQGGGSGHIELDFQNRFTKVEIPQRVLKLIAYAENMESQHRTITVTGADLMEGKKIICKEE